MHHLSLRSLRHSQLSPGFAGCQVLVRFFALYRIKPHTPPLVRAPVNSFEFHTCDRTPQAAHSSVFLRPERSQTAPTKCASFTAWTTGVSNPVCSPRFRASASELAQSPVFTFGVPIDIYAFHRSTYRSSDLYQPQDAWFAKQFHG